MSFILFLVIMALLTHVIWWAFEQLGMPVDRLSFFLGMALTMVSGALVFRLSDWYSTATRPNRPQTVTLETKDTPARITRAALGATCGIIVIVAILAVVAYAVVFVIR